MRRLYLRIYVAVLASILLSLALAAIAWRLNSEDRYSPEPAFVQEIAGRLLPPASAPRYEQQQALERWRQLSGLDLALVAPDGAMIAAAGERGAMMPHMRHRGRGPQSTFAFDLPDGRAIYLAAMPVHGPFRGFGWLAALLVIAGAVALCAWPVVRRLTRDLEELEKGVAALGQGDLGARAPVRRPDEVGRLAATFNHAAERIQTLMNANRSLLANASHELRSPLTRLRMSVEKLATIAPADVRDELARNVRELDQLVEEILLASRLDAGRVEAPQCEEVDLVALAAEECARVGADLDASASVVLQADARLLRRTLRNLLENAARHGGGGAVDMRVQATDGVARLSVCDRGPGVPEAERERIFEPFYRLPGASEADGGVGLGLSLARRIAQAHGGALICLPREGGGACFQVDLPVKR
jgi:signal transduction histidine kinase